MALIWEARLQSLPTSTAGTVGERHPLLCAQGGPSLCHKLAPWRSPCLRPLSPDCQEEPLPAAPEPWFPGGAPALWPLSPGFQEELLPAAPEPWLSGGAPALPCGP